MKLVMFSDPQTFENVYVLRVPQSEMAGVRLEGFDRMLIDECNKSESVADTLLGLELIARKIEAGR
jgi:hypothetical protein